MKLRSAAAVVALGLALAAAPAIAEDSHRQSRSGRNDRDQGYRSSRNDDRDRGYRSSRYPQRYSYRRPFYDNRYRYAVPPGPYGVGYYDRLYDPYYDPYYSGSYRPSRYDGYRRYSRGHYHGRSWCRRPHLSVHIDF